MPTYIYTRYSTEKQSEDSIEIQEKICRAYAKRKGLVIDEVFSDPATSAKYPIMERPSGKRLAARLRHGDHVITRDIYRLTRNRHDGPTVIEWAESGVGIHFADHGGNSIDLTTADGILIFDLLLAQGEHYRRKTAEITSAKAQHYRENGRRWGSVPIGKQCVDGKLVDDECEREAVEKARAMVSSGFSSRKVAARLAELGYLNRKGKPYHHNQIIRMCS